MTDIDVAAPEKAAPERFPVDPRTRFSGHPGLVKVALVAGCVSVRVAEAHR